MKKILLPAFLLCIAGSAMATTTMTASTPVANASAPAAKPVAHNPGYIAPIAFTVPAAGDKTACSSIYRQNEAQKKKIKKAIATRDNNQIGSLVLAHSDFLKQAFAVNPQCKPKGKHSSM